MPDEKLPADDDNKKEDPFEEFINRDLGMDSVLRNSPAVPPDDEDDEEFKRLSRFLRPQYRDALDEDDDEEEDDAERFQPRFGGFVGRVPSSSSTPSTSDSPFRSPFGSSRNPFSSSSSFRRLSSSRPPEDPRSLLRTEASPTDRSFIDRISDFFSGRSVADEFIFIVLVCAGLLVVVSTLLYIDNLRLSIAVRDGQIQELRAQIIELQRQLTPTLELPIPSTAAVDGQ